MEKTPPATLTAAAAGVPGPQVPASSTVAPVVLPGVAPAVVPASDKK